MRKSTRLCRSRSEMGLPSPLELSAGTTVSKRRRKNEANDGPVDLVAPPVAPPSDEIARKESQALTFSRNFSLTIYGHIIGKMQER